MRRSSSLIAAFAVAALSLTPSVADARLGSGSSFGSRGMRSYSAPPSTNTAPFAAAPLERSITPRSIDPSPGFSRPFGAQPAFGGRSAFTSGLMGGLIGAGIGGMLFGHGMFGGIDGFGSVFGLLIQLALLFFIGRWLLRRFTRQPAMAGMGGFVRTAMPQPARPYLAGGTAAQPNVAIGKDDYQAFDKLLHVSQAAWSTADMNALRQICTPEMLSYFGEQLAEQASRGVRNTVTNVHLDKGDLSEAWSEGGREYATVAMRFSMVDVTQDQAGRVVDGSPTERTAATELWTFVRAPGGSWLLSAIQQGR